MIWAIEAAHAQEIDESAVTLAVGTHVCVVDRYLGNWCPGFEVAAVVAGGYRLRRLTDGRVFPDVFVFDRVRRDRRRTVRKPEDPHFEYRQFP